MLKSKSQKLCLGLLMTILITSNIFAEASKNKYKSTNEAMGDIFNSFVNLLPYASNEMKFNDPNSREFILSNLTKINSAFKDAKHLKRMKRPGFNPSYNVIVNHLENTLEAFQRNNKAFARTRLKATTQMCMSCHTQLSNKRISKSFKGLNGLSRKSFLSDFDFGNYLFLTHQYDEAATSFEREIVTSVEKNKELEKLETMNKGRFFNGRVEKSLKRILTIYTKVKYEPIKAAELLKKYKNSGLISKFLKEEIQEWISALESWQKKKFTGRIKNEKELTAFIKKYLAPLELENSVDANADISLLIASGALYKYLDTNPTSSHSGEILYWLAVVDKQFNFSSFFDLSEVYLKQCITKNKKTPIARKCYDRFRENIVLGYSGSAGTNIPKEERDELARLKKFVK